MPINQRRCVSPEICIAKRCPFHRRFFLNSRTSACVNNTQRCCPHSSNKSAKDFFTGGLDISNFGPNGSGSHSLGKKLNVSGASLRLASKSQEARSDHGRKSPQPRDFTAAAARGHYDRSDYVKVSTPRHGIAPF